MHSSQITLDALRKAVAEFAGPGVPDAGWAALMTRTAPAIDPSVATHRDALHVWLNAWGCRIRYPRPGEENLFDSGVEQWWKQWQHALPAPGVSITGLLDADFPALGECYQELALVSVSAGPRRRGIGATAATKMLYALRPQALMPWDEAIAKRLHGRRDAASYAAHQRLGRDWSLALLAEAGMDEAELGEHLGRPGRSLAKMLDDYCYLTFTRGI
ncbi:hypothetical protein [Winogradskya humida]|uniref:Uncharacterized protein n=1 Tax=Winogradskya humida TaxID=113566 RepID=A0ABQ3ZH45_9ACTN|nr:hypothetical protein [Actinoplanes humidus]GIE17813.1 hypothetical protein Ahu01nite_009150 [Actinoplanes humidus]